MSVRHRHASPDDLTATSPPSCSVVISHTARDSAGRQPRSSASCGYGRLFQTPIRMSHFSQRDLDVAKWRPRQSGVIDTATSCRSSTAPWPDRLACSG